MSTNAAQLAIDKISAIDAQIQAVQRKKEDAVEAGRSSDLINNIKEDLALLVNERQYYQLLLLNRQNEVVTPPGAHPRCFQVIDCSQRNVEYAKDL